MTRGAVIVLGKIRKSISGAGFNHRGRVDRTNSRLNRAFVLMLIGAFGSVSQAEERVADRFIEEITVTAEKRESSLQSLPLAVTALGQEEIDVRGIEGIADLQFAVPGLVFNVATDTA